MAGMSAMMTRLNSIPLKVSTSSIFSVAAWAVSSKAFIYSSSLAKAPPRFILSFQVVKLVVTGMETNIRITPINISHHGGLSLRRPKSCI